ncbi:putative membrane protein [Gracilibacillus halotolerans]|uniref:Putative membrane protein n=1 Tax=Gracilibacillus halotolerans TaxID=74386 RepID=A0A841RK66_9BACI|nr:YhgE/Pip domain-containing protein [Gracilibacillus halotolerans]MBB6511585.1 putative membrane protein [Gracilibacillus halotolerans]
MMKNIFHIYKLDVKSIVTNVMSLVLIGGLIFLPSLYAWLNIKASWDPYAQTNQIPIGFVNEDEGANIRGEDIDVGQDLEDYLKEDNNFNWQFVNRTEGIEELEYGTFYAMIVVPKDFSETLGSVIQSEPKKATMEYFVNEKINAIAPKITDKGASVIVEELSSEFISTVNGVIFEMFNEIGLELEESMPDIEQFEEYVFTLEKELPNIHEKLVDMDDQLTKASKMIEIATNKIPEAKEVMQKGLNAIHKTDTFLQKVESEIKAISPALKEEVKEIETVFTDVETKRNEIEKAIVAEKDAIDIEAIEKELPEMAVQIDEMIVSLQKIQDELTEPNNQIEELINNLQMIKEDINHVESKTVDIKAFIEQHEQFYQDLQDNINVVTEIDLQKFVQQYEEEIEPNMLAEIHKGQQTVQQAKDKLTEINDTVPEIEAMLGNTETKISEGQEALDKLFASYPQIQDRVNSLADTIRKVQDETDIKEIVELLLNDSEKEKGFFAEPVVLNRNEVFPVPNYGTGMTPFYTVLSLWVGGLLLISLLSPNVPETALNSKITYTGRLLTFISIGLLQTLIVTMGDMFIIGVDVSHPIWFVIFGLLISFVFMSIVYTAVAILGDIGKAVAIILLVLQIASSGGTYPVVLLPEFFQSVNPFLPFTYGVDLMREAVGGIIWRRALTDIVFLIGFATISISAGVFLKGPVQAKMTKVVKSKGGRLFH